jgi:N-acetyl-alpha-D-muramate 1-phosphate uridylyltransferase
MKAMVLAAGRGERMRPLTDTSPKPLLEVRGKPIIVWTIERLARSGIVDLVINHAHLGHKIEQALGDGRRFGVAIRYSPEAEALETAGGIANALPLLGSEPFIVVNGDIYCDYDFSRLRGRSLDGRLAHLVLVPNPDHNPGGDFVLESSEVAMEGGPKLTFSGIALYRPELFRGIERGSKGRMLPLWTQAIGQRRVGGELHRGVWHDVGTPQRLAALNQPGA